MTADANRYPPAGHELGALLRELHDRDVVRLDQRGGIRAYPFRSGAPHLPVLRPGPRRPPARRQAPVLCHRRVLRQGRVGRHDHPPAAGADLMTENEQPRSPRRVASGEPRQPPKHLDHRQVQHPNQHDTILPATPKAQLSGRTTGFGTGHDSQISAAIVDRITFQANIIETGTDSYRLGTTKRKRT